MTCLQALLFWFATTFGLGGIFGTPTAPPDFADGSICACMSTPDNDSSTTEQHREGKRGKPSDRIYNGF